MHGRLLAAAAAIISLSHGAAGAESVTPQTVGCKLIRNVDQLQRISDNLAGTYCLANDIDAGAVDFVPIGNNSTPFTGKLFGKNYTIENLTISASASVVAGLFGTTNSALIQDVHLVNAEIVNSFSDSRTGALVGRVLGNTRIENVHVSGRVECTAGGCRAGGIVGDAASGSLSMSDSSSAATVGAVGSSAFAQGQAGGAAGITTGGTLTRITATGNVDCAAAFCFAGGLVGFAQATTVVDRCAATGAVAGETAGGLIGELIGSSTVRYSHASGPVSDNGSTGLYAGGLVGAVGASTIEQSYSAGKVSGSVATLGGLVGHDFGGTTVSNAYWDTSTSGQPASAGGVGLTTTQLRGVLPAGFDATVWAITANRSYPYVNDADIPFNTPLATLVKANRIYTFLPLSQLDASQYATPPANADAASLATVYTMIARAVGISKNVATLKDVKIDTYFWKDATETTTWKGPVTKRATLGALTDIPANVSLNRTNVIGEMGLRNLVILRGTFPSGGGTVTHWMLGTLYTLDSDGKLAGVVAHDPWTGSQVIIDFKTKKVVSQSDFPLTGFTVDGYQPVTLN